MAVCIMFGLTFAAILSLIVTPAMYAIFFNIHEPAATPVGSDNSEILHVHESSYTRPRHRRPRRAPGGGRDHQPFAAVLLVARVGSRLCDGGRDVLARPARGVCTPGNRGRAEREGRGAAR